jgi:predicted glycosyltransferase
MILYYAVGGGLGHLTRGRRVLEALGLHERAAFVTASPYAHDVRVTGGIPVIEVPPHLEHAPVEHRAWLRDLLREWQPERLIADAFPAGIQGELSGLPITMDHVARILRLDEYRRAVNEEMPRFDTTWMVEELAPEHEAFVRAQSGRVVALELTPAPSTPVVPEPFWLIVHSGPEEEVSELVEYAANLRDLAADPPARVIVASRCSVPLPVGFEFTDEYPVTHLFPAAARIISAAGFNVMYETAAWAEKHHVVPFPRRFDDQYLRAARRRGLRNVSC